MAKSKKETQKKPPAHEVIVAELRRITASFERFVKKEKVLVHLYWQGGTSIVGDEIIALVRVLLAMEIPEHARGKTARAVKKMFERLERCNTDVDNIGKRVGVPFQKIPVLIELG